MKTLIYSCIFFNQDYIKLFNLLLKSLKLFGNPTKTIDYLVICHPNFRKKITEIFNTLEINGKIWCIELKTKFDACCSRLKIFDYAQIDLYSKILYLDCDILITNSLNKLFDFDLEDKLYAVFEPCDRFHHGHLLNDDEFKLFSKDKSFSSGILLFNNNIILKKFFLDIISHINETLSYYNYDTLFKQKKEVDFSIIFGDQPFIIYQNFKKNICDNKKLINKVINNPTYFKGQIISHFCGTPGNYKSKIIKMNNYINFNMFFNEIPKIQFLNNLLVPPKENKCFPLIGICVSYNYMDVLKFTLPINYRHFNKIYLVTQKDDYNTINFCKNFKNVEILYCNFKTDNALFDKGAGLIIAQKKAYKYFPDHWYLIIDSDIILPNNFISILKEEKLNKHCIYGGIRNNFEKSCELMNYVEPSHHYQYNNILNDCHDFYYNFKTPPSILGCFQLYKKKNIFYQNSHDNFLNGADFDYSFGYKNFDLFCNMENLNYYHLGYGGENWKGKTVEFEDDFMIKLEHIYFNCNVKCNNFYYNSKKTLLGINKKANHKNLDIYDDVYTNSFEFRDDINNFFKDEKSYKIAEIGCYRGYTTRFLSNCFEKVYAVDNSVEYINFNINYNRDKSKNIEFIQLEKKNYWENLPDVDVILFNFYNNFEYYKPDLINLIKYTPKLKYIIFNDYGVVKEVSKLVDSALTDHILEFKKYIGLNNVSNYDYDIVKNTSEGIICKVVKQHNDIIGKNYKWNNLKLSFLEDGKLNPFENGKYINIDKYLLRCEFNNEVYLFKFSKDFSKFISVKKGNLDLLSGILITEPVMKKKNKNVEGVGFGFGFGEC